MRRLFSILFALTNVAVSIISCAQSVSGGRAVTNYNIVNNIFNIKDFGATGDGSTDDRAAIQAAIDATINAKGKLFIPTPSNYYRINGTLFFQPTKGNQAFFEVEGQGHWEYQIVYQGPSGQPAAVIDGMKGGLFTNVKIKIGDGVTDCVAWEIGTKVGGSTSGFSFYDCVATLNKGENNQGWRLGEISGGGEDISQILFSNCKAEGWSAGVVDGVQQHYRGQIGWNISGPNTLALTWSGGACIFAETGIKLEQGGSLFFHSFQTSHNGIDFHMQWANVVTVNGGRFEVGKKFLLVDQMSAHPIFNLHGVTIEDYKPTDGRIFDFRAPGTLLVDGCGITCLNSDFDAQMFTLSTPSSHPFGTFLIRGGKINASDPFVTADGWKVVVENVVRVSPDNLQSSGYFTNKSTAPGPPTKTRTFTIIGVILTLTFVIMIYRLTRKAKTHNLTRKIY